MIQSNNNMEEAHPTPDDLIPLYNPPLDAWARCVIEILRDKGIVDLNAEILKKDILRVIIKRIPISVYLHRPEHLNVGETLNWLINYDENDPNNRNRVLSMSDPIRKSS